VDSRRFAETVGRVDTQDWERRINQAETIVVTAAATPPPCRRQKDLFTTSDCQEVRKIALPPQSTERRGSGGGRLTEERVSRLQLVQGEERETMVKAWVESTSCENLAKV
jgi:hypothetical protein